MIVYRGTPNSLFFQTLLVLDTHVIKKFRYDSLKIMKSVGQLDLESLVVQESLFNNKVYYAIFNCGNMYLIKNGKFIKLKTQEIEILKFDMCFNFFGE
jgi:hypothetical protein